MYIPRRKSSLSQEVTAVEDTDRSMGCYRCCRVDSGGRRRSSNSFKVGSYIDSLVSDRTSAHKSAAVEFGVELVISDFSFHQKRGGRIPSHPRRLEATLPVQYVQWEGFGSAPMVGHFDVSGEFQDKKRGFAGFLVPYRSNLKIGVLNTEGTRVCVWILPYDLASLGPFRRRTMRFVSGAAVVQATFFNTDKKYYIGAQMHLIIREHQDEVVMDWDLKTVSESHFDPEIYWLCEQCRQIEEAARNDITRKGTSSKRIN